MTRTIPPYSIAFKGAGKSVRNKIRSGLITVTKHTRPVTLHLHTQPALFYTEYEYMIIAREKHVMDISLYSNGYIPELFVLPMSQHFPFQFGHDEACSPPQGPLRPQDVRKHVVAHVQKLPDKAEN